MTLQRLPPLGGARRLIICLHSMIERKVTSDKGCKESVHLQLRNFGHNFKIKFVPFNSELIWGGGIHIKKQWWVLQHVLIKSLPI